MFRLLRRGYSTVPRTFYVNGKFVSAEEAVVPVTDFGFNYACGVYDVAKVLFGRPFQLDEHLARFQRCCDALGIAVDSSSLKQVCGELLQRNPERNAEQGIIYMQASLGAPPLRSHIRPAALQPTIVLFTQNVGRPSAELYAKGCKLASVLDERHTMCHVKTISLLPNVIAMNNAYKSGHHEILFRTASGTVYEAGSANFWVTKGSTVYTPPLGNKVLPGITRSTLLDLLPRWGYNLSVEPITMDFVQDCDSAFITSTTRDVLFVHSLDTFVFPNHSLTKRIANDYSDWVRQEFPQYWKHY